eukprot:11044530-Alexandrium_andersonii.AAC.1
MATVNACPLNAGWWMMVALFLHKERAAEARCRSPAMARVSSELKTSTKVCKNACRASFTNVAE